MLLTIPCIYKNIIIFLLAALLSSCTTDKQSPEQQIRALLSNIESAAENRNTSQFMRHIDETYGDYQGQNKQSIKRLVTIYLLRNQNVHIFSKIHNIEINNNIATVELSAAIAAKEVDLSNEKNRLNADLHQFSIVLQDKDNTGSWLIKSASWQRGWQ